MITFCKKNVTKPMLTTDSSILIFRSFFRRSFFFSNKGNIKIAESVVSVGLSPFHLILLFLSELPKSTISPYIYIYIYIYI